MPTRRSNSGFTLIEIITTIVVVSIAATALLSVFSNMVKGSVDPMLQQQATTIAEAYLEEIQLKNYSDPHPLGELSDQTGEVRSSFDDINDYNGLPDTDVRDQNGDEIAALADFDVFVNVANSALNAITLASGNATVITITVTHPAVSDTVLHGYRTNY